MPKDRTVLGSLRAETLRASLLKLTVASFCGEATPQPVTRIRTTVPAGPDCGRTSSFRNGSGGGTQHLRGRAGLIALGLEVTTCCPGRAGPMTPPPPVPNCAMPTVPSADTARVV